MSILFLVELSQNREVYKVQQFSTFFSLPPLSQLKD